MAQLIQLKTFKETKGILSVLEDFDIPFEIKRIFYIYRVDDSVRGGHRHKLTYQALICLKGACTIENNDSKLVESFRLDTPEKCLLLDPPDWHILYDFSPDAILLVLASRNFDVDDYIFEPYK